MLTGKYFQPFIVVGFAIVMTCSAGLVKAAEPMDHSKMDHSKMDQGQQNADDHAQHKTMMDQKGYSISEVSYEVPDVMLTGQIARVCPAISCKGRLDFFYRRSGWNYRCVGFV
jgi:hypothetical protein